MFDERDRLIEVVLDAASIARQNRDIEHEREIAILDLLDANAFRLQGIERGPYRLLLGLSDDRLVFDVSDEERAPVIVHALSLNPFRRIVKDYFLICESYFEAIRTAPPSRIEAIDMGRRGLHNDGSQLLRTRLESKILLDENTARRIFTLICALHWKG
ncbi:MAG: UPF0262 family protein [Rhizobiales bacterium]|nr:UPF0262 family protein [Hyphomicrobiales bacterium]